MITPPGMSSANDNGSVASSRSRFAVLSAVGCTFTTITIVMLIPSQGVGLVAASWMTVTIVCFFWNYYVCIVLYIFIFECWLTWCWCQVSSISCWVLVFILGWLVTITPHTILLVMGMCLVDCLSLMWRYIHNYIHQAILELRSPPTRRGFKEDMRRTHTCKITT